VPEHPKYLYDSENTSLVTLLTKESKANMKLKKFQLNFKKSLFSAYLKKSQYKNKAYKKL